MEQFHEELHQIFEDTTNKENVDTCDENKTSTTILVSDDIIELYSDHNEAS